MNLSRRLTDLGNVSQPQNSLRQKMKTSSSPGGGLYLPNLNGLQATIQLAKSSKDLVIGLNEYVSTFIAFTLQGFAFGCAQIITTYKIHNLVKKVGSVQCA